MRKVLVVFIIFVCSFVCIIVSLGTKEQESNNNDTFSINGRVIIRVNGNSFIEKLNSYRYDFFITQSEVKNDLSNFDKVAKTYIETEKYIIKYSSDSKGNIAYHMNEVSVDVNDSKLYVRTINASEYGILEDNFVVYNTETNQKVTFEYENTFVEYCNKNQLELFNWKFSNGMKYRNVKLSDKSHLLMSESISLTDQFLYENKVVFEGYISKYKIQGNKVIFSIKIPKQSELEFPTKSNSNLTLSEKSTGKHFEGFAFIFPLYKELFYNRKIVFDETDGTYFETD